jgi:hypothetical protein
VPQVTTKVYRPELTVEEFGTVIAAVTMLANREHNHADALMRGEHYPNALPAARARMASEARERGRSHERLAKMLSATRYE